MEEVGECEEEEISGQEQEKEEEGLRELEGRRGER